VGEDLVGRTTGTSQALIGVATLAGSAAGGVLVGWSGHRGALLVDAATFVALAVVAALVRTRRRPEPGVAGDGGGMMAGLRAIFADQLMRVLLPVLWMFVVVGEAVNVVEVFLVTDEIGLSPSGFGAITALQGAGAIVGAWASGRLRDDRIRSRAVLVGMAAIGGSCVVMGLAGEVVTLAAGALAAGLGVGLLNAAVSSLVVTRTAEHLRGRVIAAMNGTVRSFSILALLLGGLVGTALGPRSTYVSGGALAVLTAVVAAVLMLRVKGLGVKDSELEAVSH
jgi:predicted MFS family arabinose efflux permease